MVHNVFISWSGALSQSIAVAFHEWLPTVIQAAEPFMSERDIDAGTRGLDEISSQLNDLQVGVLCVTASNQSAPWLNFEAGALSKVIRQKAYVIPLAFDIEKGQIKNPLGQFQAKNFTEEDILHTATSINKALDLPLNDVRLERAFKMAWPALNSSMEKIRSEHSQQSLVAEPKRTTENMLEELIVTVRDQSAILNQFKSMPAKSSISEAQMILTDAALRKVAEIYGASKPLSLGELTEMAPKFDEEDWAVLHTAPFLVWYLETYRDVRHTKKLEPREIDSMDDVPF